MRVSLAFIHSHGKARPPLSSASRRMMKRPDPHGLSDKIISTLDLEKLSD